MTTLNGLCTQNCNKFYHFFPCCFVGRGGNKWIAPAGCAMFSVHVRIPAGSELAEKLPFLQHIASAAVVEAVRTMPGYEVCILYVPCLQFMIGFQLVQSYQRCFHFYNILPQL